MQTCENEQLILSAFNHEPIDTIPSFVQSIMEGVWNPYLTQHEDELDDDAILLTPVGDMTPFKAFGYSSHWTGVPGTEIEPTDALKSKVAEMTADMRKRDPRLSVSVMGGIKGAAIVPGGHSIGWHVGGAIKDAKLLEWWLDNLEIVKPSTKDIEQFIETRRLCMEKNFVPIPGASLIMEPAPQMVDFAMLSILMRKNPALLRRLFDFLTDIGITRAEASLEAGSPIIVIPDDCAYKHGPMISPAQYREFVLPCLSRITSFIHEKNPEAKVFLHTDGDVYSLLDIFVEGGLDGLNPLEVNSGMNLARVKKTHGDKLAFVGNLDTAELLPYGTEEEVRHQVHVILKEGMDGDIKTGHVFSACGTLHHAVKMENAVAMMDELRKINEGIVSL
ncbi:MAG TPA: uroporphyrinogen decarboxylase family protein [Candidatus Lokiarchaeia archaeon]|nr:uroporphyrinogen decarboxylase family protein [Candidatus Lokiarchaeia archaeon]